MHQINSRDKSAAKANGPVRPRVALIVETSLASGRDILRGIARFAQEQGSWSLFHAPRGLEEGVGPWLSRWRGDGIIARIQNRAIANAVAAAHVPTVDVLGVLPESGFPIVRVDDASVSRLAAEELLRRGFRNFAFFGIAGENWSERRRDAFQEFITSKGWPSSVFESPRHFEGRMSWRAYIRDITRWLGTLPKPLGLMVCSDQCGSDVLEACRSADLAVPDEVAVIGVDDDEPLCEVCHPPLSSVLPGHVKVGYEAAALLQRLMSRSRPPTQPVLIHPQNVVVRRSTDVLAVEDAVVANALRFIRDHACEGVSVDQVARAAGVSRSDLQRRFRRVLSRAVHDELVAARIKRAVELLTNSNLSLDEIAERAGFNHQAYMSAVFRLQMNATPSSVRRASK